MNGFNVNCSEHDFATDILIGIKTIETRDTNSLKNHIGQRMYLIKTGCGPARIVGEVTIGNPVVYATQDEFDHDRYYHKIYEGSKYYIKPGKKKYGYPMIDPYFYSCEYVVKQKGIVVRKNIRLADCERIERSW